MWRLCRVVRALCLFVPSTLGQTCGPVGDRVFVACSFQGRDFCAQAVAFKWMLSRGSSSIQLFA